MMKDVSGVKMVSPPNHDLEAAVLQRDILLLDPNVLLCLIDLDDFHTETYYRNCYVEEDRIRSSHQHYLKQVLGALSAI